MLSKLSLHILCFLLVATSFVSAVGLEINISEAGKVTSFYDDYFVTQVNGTILITNTEDTELYNIELPLYLSTLTVLSADNSEDAYIENDRLFILSIGSNESIEFKYSIIGISTENLNSDGDGILFNAITAQDPKIYSTIMGTLFKAPLEIPELGGRNNTRVVSAHLINPTGFRFNVDLIKVIKTAALDPNNQLDSWDFTGEITELGGSQTYKFDILDRNATEGEIYWLQSDVYIDDITINSQENVSAFDQDDLFVIPPNESIISENLTGEEILEKRIFVRKLVEDTLVIPGQTQNITVIVNNFGNTKLTGFLEDFLPEGFVVDKSFTEGASINDRNLSWDLSINPRTSQRFLYQTTFTDTESLGVDYFDPAVVTYGSETIYSRSVPFVRQYVPEKKVYVQKSLDFRANGDVEVSITVRNLGEARLSNLIVREYLSSDNEFKEITKPFTEKGVWRIESIAPGEIWETSYVTDKTNVLNSFPDIFGISRASVFQNILLKNVVESSFKILDVSSVEVGGIIVLLLGLIVYLLPNSVIVGMKKKFVKDLYLTRRELSNLKQSTSPQASQSATSQQPVQQQTPVQSHQEHSRQHTIHDQQREARQRQIDETQSILDKIKQDLDKKE